MTNISQTDISRILFDEQALFKKRYENDEKVVKVVIF